MKHLLAALRPAALLSPLLIATTLTLAPTQTLAQEREESGGLLVDFLEDTLSGESRAIRVTGLEGALSSQATLEKLTVADSEGIWLTIEGAELDWNRLGLLRGDFSVNTLKADRIHVARAPAAPLEDSDLPPPEAAPFQLPELPVSINIGEIKVGRLTLGQDLIGVAAVLSLDGSLSLAEGTLDSALQIARLDRDSDRLDLKAGFANDTGNITIDMVLEEDDGGLVSTALALPGGPDIRLALQGSGPVEDFSADLTLDTDGARRIGGTVVLAAAGDAPADPALGRRPIGFRADLTGDITALVDPVYQPFFGPDMRARLRGQTRAMGGVMIDDLALTTQALDISGFVEVAAGGALESADLRADVTPPPGQEAVVLPVAGGSTTVTDLSLRAEKPAGRDWTMAAQMERLNNPDLRIARAELEMTGTLDQSQGLSLDGQIAAALTGLVPTDPALAEALGAALTFDGRVTTDGPGALRITDMLLLGTDYGATGAVTIDGLESGLRIAADIEANAQNLARFSGLAGQSLDGRMTATAVGSATPLSGAFDIDLSVLGQDLSAGLKPVDDLIGDTTTIALKAARDEAGLRIDRFELDAKALTAQANGQLGSTSGQLSLSATLKQLEKILPQAPGPLEFSADITRENQIFSGSAELRGPKSSRAELTGQMTTNGDGDLQFDAAINALERFVPTLAGSLSAKGTASRRAGVWTFDGAAEGPTGLSADLDGTVSENKGDADITFDALVAEVQRFVPGLPGRLTAEGTARRRDGIWQINSRAIGPAGVTSTVAGSWDEVQGRADIDAKGQLRLEGLNPFISPNLIRGPAQFDLSLKGEPSLANLSGQIRTSGTSLAIPAAAQRIDAINATVSIARSRANIQLTAAPRDGGQLRVTGPVGLTAPFDAQLQIALANIGLSDQLSYETELSGALTLSGGLIGTNRLSGRIDVGETNINLATAGGSVTAAPIPDIRHQGEPAEVRRTRARAGLIDSGNGGGDGSGRTLLDVLISAPNRINARGRGVRAELGGQIQLRGSTANLAPAGQISLIRGTFDILGRRLALDEGRITLQGDLRPYLLLRSSAATSEGTATLELSGLIDSPSIKVTSDPERPSEEALALLLFGDNIQDLSPLALARLAGSVASLSGRGGSNRAEGKLRDETGASNVELGLDNLGAGLLDIGGYVSENVYTDFNVNTRGDSELSINLDVSKSLTVTGKVDGEGETGVGLFFKRDY
ncbi:translocation/assembly module TamB domain-containing protein [Phaeobacter sp. HS012]|uniref:translocation/assembly module TamB domain-containing protein n=1 Tax=unclassified Phaeobacter TaxID=2621772 RepID=UPI001B389B46|nr:MULTISPECIES: translocation/assembly module TamB domain-containing protein [unclassified Phaeobacter]MBQ4808594.1 translocation/assembly module TamB domain-containing protein [Phaeobacter sp. HS012]MBQ4883187.1 translocation/assembly module TamB domain-containing protein [Phaeobacter sp. HS011]